MLLGVWACGVLAVGLWAGSAALGIRAIHRRSEPVDEDTFGLGRYAMLLGVKRRLSVRLGAEGASPTAMTWGVLRPVIFLPDHVRTWSQSRIDSVLLHEMAHIRRLDFLSQAMSVAACAIFWFNPFAWLGARAMRLDSEFASDDDAVRAAARAGMAASDYAAELLALAAQLGSRRSPRTALSVAMIKRPNIESRIRSVLDTHKRRGGLTWNQAGLLFFGGATLVFFGLVVRPSLQQRSRLSEQVYQEALYVLSLRKQPLEARAEADPGKWRRYVPRPRLDPRSSPSLGAGRRPESATRPTGAGPTRAPGTESHGSKAERVAAEADPPTRRVPEVAKRAYIAGLLADGSLRPLRMTSGASAAKLASIPAKQGSDGASQDGSRPAYVDLPPFSTIEAAAHVRVVFKNGPRYRIAFRWADGQTREFVPEVKAEVLSLTDPSDAELQVLVEAPRLGAIRLSGTAQCACEMSQKGELAVDVSGGSALSISGATARISAKVSGGSRLAVSGSYPRGFTAAIDGASALALSGRSGAVSLDLGGASRASLESIDAGDLTLGLAGDCAVAALGRSKSVSMRLAGGSRAAAEDLRCGAAHVEAAGNSAVSLGAPKSLWASASGDSHVTYKGNPKPLTKQIQDSSTVLSG